MRVTTLRFVRLAVGVVLATGTWEDTFAAERRPMEPLDVLKIEQLNNPEISPDGN